MLRLNADASFDTTFGSGGRVFTPTGLVPTDFVVNGGAVQADGKILLIGSVAGTTTRSAEVLRLNADGSVDTTYGVDGVRAFAFRSASAVEAGDSDLTQAELDAQGRLVVAGTLGKAFPIPGQDPVYARSGAAFARLTTSGDLDTTFGTDAGMTVLPYTPADTSTFFSTSYAPTALFVSADGIAADGASGLTVLPLGRPVVGDRRVPPRRLGPPAGGVRRRGTRVGRPAPGRPDPVGLLGVSQRRGDRPAGPHDRRRLVLLDLHRKLVRHGRLAADDHGALDATFGDAATPGVVRRLVGTGPALSSVDLQPDGSLLLAGIGSIRDPSSGMPTTLDLTKLDPSGQPDLAFAPGGRSGRRSPWIPPCPSCT